MNTETTGKTTATPLKAAPVEKKPVGINDLWAELGGTMKGVIVIAVICIVIVLLALIAKLIIG